MKLSNSKISCDYSQKCYGNTLLGRMFRLNEWDKCKVVPVLN